MSKVLFYMDYGKDCHTGYATVSRNIKKHLKNYFKDAVQIDVCAINHFGNSYTEDDGTFVFSAKRSDIKNDDFGRFVFLKILAEDDSYDAVFIIQDLGIIQPIIPVMQSILEKRKSENKKRFKTIFYFPVDCVLFPVLVKGLEFFDHIITYTEFGKKEVLKLRPDLLGKIKAIPHGNNFSDFHPIEQAEKEGFRKFFFEENADKFIVTNVNRNQPRKDIPNTIFGFIEAKKMAKESGYDIDLFLYLHCHPKDPKGNDIRAIMLQTQLEEDVDYKLLPKVWEHNLCSRKELNQIYNASDVYLTTTLGEGWGLVASEAMSAKLPCILPYNTSLMEMSGFGSRAYMLRTMIPYCGKEDNIIREQTDYVEVAEKIIGVAIAKRYGNENDVLKMELNSKIEKSYNYVQSLDWGIVCKKWIEIFKSTI